MVTTYRRGHSIPSYTGSKKAVSSNIERTSEVVGGKVRKYYSLTGRGQQALEDLRFKIRELVTDVLDGQTVPARSGQVSGIEARRDG